MAAQVRRDTVSRYGKNNFKYNWVKLEVMKRLLLILTLPAVITACRNKDTREQTLPGKETLPSLTYTLYSDKTEMFTEFRPLIADQPTVLGIHLTRLGERFLPYTEGKVTIGLYQDGRVLRDSTSSISSPGIFNLTVKPARAGTGKLVIDFKTADHSDQFVIDSVIVFADMDNALAAGKAIPGGSNISFTKEQAWQIEFASAPVKKETMHAVVKATGQLESAPGDEVIIAARSNGILRFLGNSNVTGAAIRAGQAMFAVTGGEIAFENIDAARESTRAELATATSEYERAGELIKDKLITQSEYQQAKLRYEQARIRVNNLGRHYGAGGNSLSSPINGFVRNILVSEGQYVNAGQPLATISRNQQLILRVDVSLKDADKIAGIREANFRLGQDTKVYNTRELGGRLVSVGKAAGPASPFLPVHFQIKAGSGILPGSLAEVFLMAGPVEGALVIPVSALIEEQGIYYLFVQTGGESFQKREVKLGANDGQKVQLLSGIAEGERVVTRGGYHIKLAQASGAMPEHEH